LHNVNGDYARYMMSPFSIENCEWDADRYFARYAYGRSSTRRQTFPAEWSSLMSRTSLTGVR
jgi:hypothetical protein